MGLAGRKEKQKIGPDPRNLTWAQDDSRFGQQYLAKFGWTPDSGSGLGANGDGRLAHITVAQKLNLLGIGNGPSGGGTNTPDAIAWKQNKDFEGVLKRLNGVEEPEVKFEKALLHGFVGGEITESTIENEPEVVDEKAERRRRKEEKKRLKQERANGNGESLRESLQASTSALSQQQTLELSSNTTPITQSKPSGMGPRLAHRAKFRASKQLASVSSAALSEILGIAGSGSATPVSGAHSITPASNSGNVTSTGRDEQLTTSTTSVADYFAAKMKARREGTQLSSQSQTPIDVASPPPEEEVQEEEAKSKEKKREKKRKREEGQKDAMVVDQEQERNTGNEEPQKRRKEKGLKETKKKRRKDD